MSSAIVDLVEGVRHRLQEMPGVECLDFKLFPPRSEEEMDRLLAASGRDLPASLRSFYAHTDGWQVAWLHSDNPDYQRLRKKWEALDDDWWRWRRDYISMEGVIQILPLELLLGTSGENRWWFPGEVGFPVKLGGETKNSLAVKQNLQLLDVFHKFYCAALYWPEKGEEPIVLLGQDHEADFFGAPPLTVNAYLNFLSQSLGALDAREHLLNPRSKR